MSSAEGITTHHVATASTMRRAGRVLVFVLDAVLRRSLGIHEYSVEEGCLFRVGLGRAEAPLTLSDGTVLRPGDTVLDLHFWNERLPRIDPRGPDLAWAGAMTRAFDLSLRQLAAHLEADRRYRDVKAIRGELSVAAGARRAQLLRLTRRFGFEPSVAVPDRRAIARLHRFGQNILIWLITWAQNPATLSRDMFRRGRLVVYLSRERLAGFMQDAAR